MVVRFLPARPEPQPEEGGQEAATTELAEVVQLRTRLAPPEAADVVPSESLKPSVTAIERSIKLLARRALSAEELAVALRSEGFVPDEVTEAVHHCAERSYIDDLALAERLIERADGRKKLSRSALQRKLRERLISSEIIDQALLNVDPETEEGRMRAQALERAPKLLELDRRVAERRLVGYLARRGFSGSAVSRIAREALDSALSERG